MISDELLCLVTVGVFPSLLTLLGLDLRLGVADLLRLEPTDLLLRRPRPLSPRGEEEFCLRRVFRSLEKADSSDT